MEVLGKSFDRNAYEAPKLEPPKDPTESDFIEVKLLISQHAKYRIYDEFAEGDIETHEDGTITIRMSPAQWIYDYILSYGMTAEVLEPQHIRDEILARAEKIKNKYLRKT